MRNSIVVAVLFWSVLGSKSCFAGPFVLDQEFVSADPSLLAFTGDYLRGQTYTAGTGGTLVAINVDINPGSVFGPLHFVIARVQNGLPTSTMLGETTLSTNSAPLSLLITFPDPISQVAGEQYAILVDSPGATLPSPFDSVGNWIGVTGNQYGRGEFVTRNQFGVWLVDADSDLHFRTFVEIPEPGARSLVLAGIIALMVLLRRRRTA